MIQTIKKLKYELSDKYGRLRWYSFFVRNIPGVLGQQLRINLFRRYFSGCGRNITIFPGVRFRGIHKLHIGNEVFIGVDAFLQASGGITLCDGVILGPGVKIWSINHIYNDTTKPIIQQGYESSEVIIGAGCWLGANVIVLPGVTLPEGCVVSAGAVVGVKKYPPFALIAGNPARVIGNRKKEH